jgi:hypothetical protein
MRAGDPSGGKDALTAETAPTHNRVASSLEVAFAKMKVYTPLADALEGCWDWVRY